MTTQQREAFESFISSPPFEKSVDRYPDRNTESWRGQYKLLDVQLAWEAWQAAQARQEEVEQELNELAAMVGRLREALNEALGYADDHPGMPPTKSMHDALNETPPTALRHIKAEAGKAGYIAGAQDYGNTSCYGAAEDYAQQLRNGEVE